MIKKFKSWLSKRKLWQKLLAVYLSVSVIPLSVIIFFTYFFTVKIANEQIVARLETMTDGVGTNLLDNLDITDNIIGSLIYSDSFLHTVTSAENTAGRHEENLSYLLSLNRALNAFFGESSELKLYFPDGTSVNASGNLQSNVDFESLSKKCGSDSLRYITCNRETVSIYYPIINFYNGGERVAILEFSTNSERFIGSVAIEGSDEYIFIVQNDMGETIYLKTQTEGDYGNIVLNMLKRTDNNTVRIRDEVFIYHPLYLEEFNWNISVLIPRSVLYQGFPTMLISCIVIGIICLVLVSTCSIISSLSLSRRINNIGSEMALISDGQLEDIRINVDSTADEIGRLSSMFHQMIEKINSLIIEQYKNEIKSKEEQLKILQNQINPHFLYNCMDTINWRCIMNNDEKTSKFANNLADFYRTCLNKGNTRTSLNNEFRNIRAYIYLQLDMHDDSFDYEESIDSEILQYECINLMLQPIVENAIGHGLELSDQQRGFIRITGGFADEEKNEIIIKVFNNGKPIEPEIAKAVKEGRKGYGLSNVVNRIRLYFGVSAALNIEAAENGTICTITIPARRWEG